MVVAALPSYTQGKKHKSNVDFFFYCFQIILSRQYNTSTESEALSARKLAISSKLGNLIIPVSVAKAEIRWVLKEVDSNFSLRSCLDFNDLFRVMFVDGTITKNFQLNKTKREYCIKIVVTSYVRRLSKETTEFSSFLTILFDESLNGYVQKEQRSIKIRFWCDDKCKMTTR